MQGSKRKHKDSSDDHSGKFDSMVDDNVIENKRLTLKQHKSDEDMNNTGN